MPRPRSKSTAATEKGELRNTRPRFSACAASSRHWSGVNSIRRPIVVTRWILLREADPERLVQGRLGSGDMGLELYRVRASASDGIDEGMRQPKRAVMRLRDFRDNQGRAARPDLMASDAQAVHLWDPRLKSVSIYTRLEHDLTARARVYPKPAVLTVHVLMQRQSRSWKRVICCIWVKIARRHDLAVVFGTMGVDMLGTPLSGSREEDRSAAKSSTQFARVEVSCHDHHPATLDGAGRQGRSCRGASRDLVSTGR